MRIIFFTILFFIGCTPTTKKDKLLSDIRKKFSDPWSYTIIDESKVLKWDSLYSPYLTRINLYPPGHRDTVVTYFLDVKYRDTAIIRMIKDYFVGSFKAALQNDSLTVLFPQSNFNKQVMAITYLRDTILMSKVNDKFKKDFNMSEIGLKDIMLEDIKQEEADEPPPPPPPPRPKKN